MAGAVRSLNWEWKRTDLMDAALAAALASCEVEGRSLGRLGSRMAPLFVTNPLARRTSWLRFALSVSREVPLEP